MGMLSLVNPEVDICLFEPFGLYDLVPRGI